MGTVIVSLIVVAVLGYAVYSTVKTRKSGGCGCGCDGCSKTGCSTSEK